MKKVGLILVMSALFIGCTKIDVLPTVQVQPELVITNNVGIKLRTPFVTSEVAMNIKTETSQVVTVKILDIANRVVSKEQLSVKAGDNIVKVYTSALPRSAYRIGLFDAKNNMLAITDFNKL